ncbi:hypothetical protein PanWU01x14_062000 [Parasponia andersonii]|uniref:Uncharacterized protein n=1 Tax=Parasponia andersonii TaxID=3476 RepID=A0A2P5DIG3_PARAD|nr:hypothetical protein PanWU01x14_062000 [Parasponia andersonii]
MAEKLECCTAGLKQWSSGKYGHIPYKMKRILGNLDKAYAGPYDSNSLASLRRLEKERDRIMSLEEEFWRQRSRAEWVKVDDRNTMFFHSKTSQHRNKNTITSLIGTDSKWCEDAHGVVQIIEHYFNDIFHSSWPSEASISRSQI